MEAASRHLKCKGLFTAALVLNISVLLASQILDSFSADYKIEGLVNLEAEKTYSLMRSVSALYEHNSPGLATLILSFSIVWPHAKVLLIVFSIWSEPSHRLNRVVHWLCTLGKWSFFDAFTVLLLGTVVRAELHILATTGYVVVLVGSGVYVFCVAIALSQVIGTMARAAFFCSEERVVPKEQHRFRRRFDPDFFGCYPFLAWIVAMGAVLAVALLLPFVSVESQFEFEGKSLPLRKLEKLSVVDCILYGLKPLPVSHTINQALSVISGLLVVALPLCEILVMLTLCLLRADRRGHVGQLWLLDFASQCSCLEVFLAAAVVVKAEAPALASHIDPRYTLMVSLEQTGFVTLVVVLLLQTLLRFCLRSEYKEFIAAKYGGDYGQLTARSSTQQQQANSDTSQHYRELGQIAGGAGS